MADKEMVGVRISQDTLKQVQEYAESRDVSKSEALRRMIVKGIDLQEAGITVAAADTDSGSNEPITDGGQVFRPMLSFMGAFYGALSIFLFGTLTVAAITGIGIPLVGFSTVFGMMFSAFLLVAVLMPILYTDIPEKVDGYLYSSVSRVSSLKPGILGGNA